MSRADFTEIYRRILSGGDSMTLATDLLCDYEGAPADLVAAVQAISAAQLDALKVASKYMHGRSDD